MYKNARTKVLRVVELSVGEKNDALVSFVLIHYQIVTDGQTDISAVTIPALT